MSSEVITINDFTELTLLTNGPKGGNSTNGNIHKDGLTVKDDAGFIGKELEEDAQASNESSKLLERNGSDQPEIRDKGADGDGGDNKYAQQENKSDTLPSPSPSSAQPIPTIKVTNSKENIDV